jgi:hypothetical protein
MNSGTITKIYDRRPLNLPVSQATTDNTASAEEGLGNSILTVLKYVTLSSYTYTSTLLTSKASSERERERERE